MARSFSEKVAERNFLIAADAATRMEVVQQTDARSSKKQKAAEVLSGRPGSQFGPK
jgi:hypothetical protein